MTMQIHTARHHHGAWPRTAIDMYSLAEWVSGLYLVKGITNMDEFHPKSGLEKQQMSGSDKGYVNSKERESSEDALGGGRG